MTCPYSASGRCCISGRSCRVLIALQDHSTYVSDLDGILSLWRLQLAVQRTAVTDDADTPADASETAGSVSDSLCAIRVVHDKQCRGRCGDHSIECGKLQRFSKVLSQHECTERYHCACTTASQLRKYIATNKVLGQHPISTAYTLVAMGAIRDWAPLQNTGSLTSYSLLTAHGGAAIVRTQQ